MITKCIKQLTLSFIITNDLNSRILMHYLLIKVTCLSQSRDRAITVCTVALELVILKFLVIKVLVIGPVYGIM